MEDKPLSKDEIEARIGNISKMAATIFDLMAFGQTIEVIIETKPNIILPNTKPVMHALIITKPSMHINSYIEQV